MEFNVLSFIFNTTGNGLDIHSSPMSVKCRPLSVWTLPHIEWHKNFNNFSSRPLKILLVHSHCPIPRPTDRHLQNPMEICIGLCLSSMNTSMQFLQAIFFGLCLGVWQYKHAITSAPLCLVSTIWTAQAALPTCKFTTLLGFVYNCTSVSRLQNHTCFAASWDNISCTKFLASSLNPLSLSLTIHYNKIVHFWTDN